MQLPNNTVPVVIGAVIGIISISVLSFANGWVVTSQKMQSEMTQANIDVQAAVCAARAEKYLTDSNNTDDIQGYQAGASEKRAELARAHFTAITDDSTSASTIVNACAGMLNKSRS